MNYILTTDEERRQFEKGELYDDLLKDYHEQQFKNIARQIAWEDVIRAFAIPEQAQQMYKEVFEKEYNRQIEKLSLTNNPKEV